MAISRLVPAYYSTVYGQLATGFPGAATGGTEVTSGGYKYHTFTSSGTLTVTSAGLFEVLVVGGGGAGGAYYYAGGGGAGGLFNSSLYLAAGSHSIVIGAGGAGYDTATYGTGAEDIGWAQATGAGGTTQLGSISIPGGGTGGCYLVYFGSVGGSGGGNNGAAGYSNTVVAQWSVGGRGISGLGNNGGGLITSPTTYTAGAGGGGAGAVGGEGGGTDPGDGGAGLDFSTWATATSTGDSGYYAGGGGGGAYTQAVSSGGAGGGGAGGKSGTVATSGTANTGGGGGGTGYNNGASGSGGSGIVIVRYAV